MCYGGGDDGFGPDVADMSIDVGYGGPGSFGFLADDGGDMETLYNSDDMSIGDDGNITSDGATLTYSNGSFTIGPGAITLYGPGQFGSIVPWVLEGITGNYGSLDFGVGGSWTGTSFGGVGISIGFKF